MSTAHERLTGHRSITERIEQAIARGLTAARIAAVLQVDVEQVHRVWDRLDALDDEDAEPVVKPTMRRTPRVAPKVIPPEVATLPTYWQGRPVESYFGPAAPEVIERLVDAVCPPRSRRSLRALRGAA